ncbi:MAG TPA: hypothetical protein VFR75_04490, partial [Solirubrobacterales bacterium]|nr:hypothetical protein [Solirubrobacterales bacterium]
SPIGAAEVELEGGERVWWDYRNWRATNHVPAVVGSWPAPFDDAPGPVSVECEGAASPCDAVREALASEGVEIAPGAPEKAIRVLVGTWDRLRADPTARLIEEGPAESGVYAEFISLPPGPRLLGLNEAGEVARRFGADTGLIAATSRYGGLPVWVVTGATPAAVRAAAEALDAEHLRDHYAVAIKDGKSTPLPLEGG